MYIYIYIYPFCLAGKNKKACHICTPPKECVILNQDGSDVAIKVEMLRDMVWWLLQKFPVDTNAIWFSMFICYVNVTLYGKSGGMDIYTLSVFFFQMLNFRSWKSWGLLSRCFWWWILLKDIKTHYLRRTFMARNGNYLEKDRVNSALLTVLLTLWLLLGVPCWILYAKCLVGYLACCEVYRTLPFGKIVVDRNTCWTCF